MATTKTTACHKVLAVPELLEMILLNLPPKDVLFAQRVNTAFRDAIETSTPLRRAISLSPSPAQITEGSEREVTVNDLVLKPSRYGMYSLDIPGFEEGCIYSPEAQTPTLNVYCITEETIDDLETFLDTNKASWLDMYLQSPAVATSIPLSHYGDSITAGKHWAYAQATVSPATVRELLTMAICLQKAAGEYEQLHMRRDDLDEYNGDDAQRDELKVVCDKVVNGKEMKVVVEDATIEFDCYGGPMEE